MEMILNGAKTPLCTVLLDGHYKKKLNLRIMSTATTSIQMSQAQMDNGLNKRKKKMEVPSTVLTERMKILSLQHKIKPNRRRIIGLKKSKNHAHREKEDALETGRTFVFVSFC